MMKTAYQGTMEKAASSAASGENISAKQTNEICYKIKGMQVNKAIKYLDRVIAMKDFVPFRRYNTGVAHRKGGKPGRYPIKAAKVMKNLVESAKSNAEFKGLDAEKLFIIHANAHKSLILNRIKSKGRSKPSRITLSKIEIVVREM